MISKKSLIFIVVIGLLFAGVGYVLLHGLKASPLNQEKKSVIELTDVVIPQNVLVANNHISEIEEKFREVGLPGYKWQVTISSNTTDQRVQNRILGESGGVEIGYGVSVDDEGKRIPIYIAFIDSTKDSKTELEDLVNRYLPMSLLQINYSYKHDPDFNKLIVEASDTLTSLKQQNALPLRVDGAESE